MHKFEFCPKICRSILIKFRRKQNFWRKSIKLGNAKKVSKAHVTPVWGQNVCDSTTEKEICVRFAIAISAIQTVDVTRLVFMCNIEVIL